MKLIRKVSVSKWKESLKVGPDHLSADAVTGCLRTQENTLSFWCSDNDADQEKSLLALGSTLTQFATINYVLIDSEVLEKDSLVIVESDGKTPAITSNSLHRDVVDLDYSALEKVAIHVKDKVAKDDFFTLAKGEVKDLLLKAIDDGTVDESQLGEKIRQELAKARAKSRAGA